MNPFQTLAYFLQYPFVVYAFIVGTLIALCASLFGVTLVLKRFSFIGDGLSHVAFGAMAIATIFNVVNDIYIIMPVTIISAVLLLKSGQNTKIKGDAAIAMFSVTALAFGYLIMNIFSTSANVSGDVCSTLFGSSSILTLDKKDVAVCIVLSMIVIGLFIIFYNKLFAITFDENFARATGTNTGTYNMFIAIIIAVIIVMGMKLVGSLLISALVIFPALSAMQLFRNFKSVVVISAVIAVVCALVGMGISVIARLPVGATIVAMNVFVFAIFSFIGRFRKV